MPIINFLGKITEEKELKCTKDIKADIEKLTELRVDCADYYRDNVRILGPEFSCLELLDEKENLEAFK